MGREAAVPSNLTYRERLALGKESKADYNRLYVAGAAPSVWDRLCKDARHRQGVMQSREPYYEGGNVPSRSNTVPGANTGFSSNSHPACSYRPGLPLKTGHLDNHLGRTPVQKMHPIVAKKFKQRDPIEFLATVRPDTESTNQTLRMMGTYEPDFEIADRFNMHIPAVCPGGKPFFHPDVHLTYRSKTFHNPATKTHKAWNDVRFGMTGSAARAVPTK